MWSFSLAAWLSCDLFQAQSYMKDKTLIGQITVELAFILGEQQIEYHYRDSTSLIFLIILTMELYV